MNSCSGHNLATASTHGGACSKRPSTTVMDCRYIIFEGYRIMFDQLAMQYEDDRSLLIEGSVALQLENHRLEAKLKRRKQVVREIAKKFDNLQGKVQSDILSSCSNSNTSSNNSSAIKSRVENVRGNVSDKDTNNDNNNDYDNDYDDDYGNCNDHTRESEPTRLKENINHFNTNSNISRYENKTSHGSGNVGNDHKENKNTNRPNSSLLTERLSSSSSSSYLPINNNNNLGDARLSISSPLEEGIAASKPLLGKGWSLKRSHSLMEPEADPCGFEIGEVTTSTYVPLVPKGISLSRRESLVEPASKRLSRDNDRTEGLGETSAGGENRNEHESERMSIDSKPHLLFNKVKRQVTSGQDSNQRNRSSNLEYKDDRSESNIKQNITAVKDTSYSNFASSSNAILSGVSTTAANVPKLMSSERKFVETVRNRDARAALPGYTCPECKSMYDMNVRQGIIKPGQLYECLKECSRHKAKNTPPNTPEGAFGLSINTPDEWRNG